ncbi:hypothetical protein ABK040_010189 [Willaertia magna]
MSSKKILNNNNNLNNNSINLITTVTIAKYRDNIKKNTKDIDFKKVKFNNTVKPKSIKKFGSLVFEMNIRDNENIKDSKIIDKDIMNISYKKSVVTILNYINNLDFLVGEFKVKFDVCSAMGIELYVELLQFKEAIEIAYQEKDVGMLRWIKSKSTNPKTKQTIDDLINKL